MSRFALWLTRRRLQSKLPAERLRAIRELRTGNAPAREIFFELLADPAAEVRREAILALSDQHDDHLLPELLRHLNHRDETVQDSAMQIIKRLGERAAADALVQKLFNGSDAIQWRAAQTLESIGWQPKNPDEEIKFAVVTGQYDRLAHLGAPAIAALAEVLETAATERRVAAVEVLGEIGGVSILKPLQRALKNPEAQIRTAAACALARAGLREAAPALIAALRDGDHNTRAAVAAALGTLGDSQAVEPLMRLLDDSDWEVRSAALEALGKIGDVRAMQPVAARVADADSDVRAVAIDALGKVGDDSVLEKLLLTTVDAHSGVRSAAIRALNKVDPHWETSERVLRLLPKIQEALKNKDAAVQLAAAELLHRIASRTKREPLLPNPDDGSQRRQLTLPTVLRELLRDADAAVRRAAANAVAKLGLTVPAENIPAAAETDVIAETFISSANNEVLFDQNCDGSAARKILDLVLRRAEQLARTIPHGEFKRLEAHSENSRLLVIASWEGGLVLRTAKNSAANAPETVRVPQLPDDEQKERASAWLRELPLARGVLLRGLRFADRTVFCDLDSRDIPVAALESACRCAADTFPSLAPGAEKATRLSWWFERAALHFIRRNDGTIFAAVTGAKLAATDLADLEKQFAGFRKFASV